MLSKTVIFYEWGFAMTFEKCSFAGVPECFKIGDDKLELIITASFGPRILFCGRPGGYNFLKIFENDIKSPVAGKWNSYGGHRLWHAPELMPRTYFPDNAPVAGTFADGKLVLDCPPEVENGLKKEIIVSIVDGKAEIVHRFCNISNWDIRFSPWAITVMAAGTTVFIPQEPFIPHGENDIFSPARPLVLWPYTDMSDPRFVWGRSCVKMSETGGTSKQKIGMLNKSGTVMCEANGVYFVKKFPFVPDGEYPDYGCNCEFFTMEGMLEVESIAPLTTVAPGRWVEHVEEWEVFDSKPFNW